MEDDDDWLFLVNNTLDATPDERKEHYRLLRLMDEGFVTSVGRSTYRLTAAGPDIATAVGNDTIWAKTKSGATAIGGATMQMLGQIAIGCLKQAARRLGIPLDQRFREPLPL